MGPPYAPDHCWRLKGGAPAVVSMVVGSACHAPSRRYIDAEPFDILLPDRVTTLVADEAVRPCVASKRFVAIWNSCTASIGRFSSGPPTTSSSLSWPSMV